MSGHPTLLIALIGLLTALGGGGIGSWLMHLRLAPKASAEAQDITAAAMDKDWARFQREISRLVERCEKAEAGFARATAAMHACEEREINLKSRVTQLEAVAAARGEIRQRAAEVVAADRTRERDGGDWA